MAGFLYYVPMKPGRTIGPPDLAAVEFPHAAELAGLPGCQVSKGPAGPGWIFTLGPFVNQNKRDPRTGYYPDAQTWHDCGGWWLGVETEKPPGPQDLQYTVLDWTHPVMLGDGQPWPIPVIRRSNGGSSMEWTWGLEGVDTGRLDDVGHVKRADADLWASVQTLVGAIIGQGPMLDRAAVDRMLVAVFGRLYRVSGFELTVLGLITTRSLERIFVAIIDFPNLIRMMDDAR